MSLRALPTDPHFVTSTDNLIDRFYVPALERSISYDRGVGYFTSNWLRLAATGLAGLATNRGRARIIASPMLDRKDCAALSQGIDARNDPKLRVAMEQAIEDLERDLAHDTLSALAWMIADGLLDFRVAVPTADLDGDFHDKFGVFRDSAGDAIAFHGSPNDSERAFRNYESISVYYSWLDSREAMRVENEQRRFDLIWDNGDINLRVYALPNAIRRNLIAFTSRSARPYPQPVNSNTPSGVERWCHQTEAAAAFFKARHGILEMATGTGKTRTALNIHEELTDRDMVATTVVTTYGTDLLDQWYRALITRTELPVYRQYGPHKEGSAFFSCQTPRILIISRQQLAATLPHMDQTTVASGLLICDEIHGFGSPAMVRDLTGEFGRFRFRLGLSATPEREYDEAGNAFIEQEIGPVIFRFTLEDAICNGILCEFDYEPLPYSLSDEDRANIRNAIKRHHARRASGEAVSDEALYRDIAHIRKTSLSKIDPFRDHIRAHPDLYKRSLLFVETAAFGHAVQPVLMDARIDYHTYYQSEDRDVLERFARGDLDCLVSCHRLSEGIDIKSVENIVLFASSRSELETTQRLGRCLRIDPSNPQKRAHVLDFVDRDFENGEDANNPDNTDEKRYRRLTYLSQVRRRRLADQIA